MTEPQQYRRCVHCKEPITLIYDPNANRLWQRLYADGDPRTWVCAGRGLQRGLPHVPEEGVVVKRDGTEVRS